MAEWISNRKIEEVKIDAVTAASNDREKIRGLRNINRVLGVIALTSIAFASNPFLGAALTVGVIDAAVNEFRLGNLWRDASSKYGQARERAISS
ncbi:MAG: hypothetical protein ACHQUA_02075 [Microgenomates group bacterium]